MNHLKDINTNMLVNKDNTENVLLDIPNYHQSPDHAQMVDIAAKSQKITTALYMVTELNKGADPLMMVIRKTTVAIMEQLFKVVSSKEEERVALLSEVISSLASLVAYLQIVYKNGKVSAMNYQLLVSEIQKMHGRIEVLITKSMPYDRKRNAPLVVDEFTFSESFFETPQTKEKDSKKESSVVKDSTKNLKDTKSIHIGHNKKTIEDNNKKDNSTSPIGHEKKAEPAVAKPAAKKKASSVKVKAHDAKKLRHENILKILKQKKDAKISDLSALIQDCSTKTIQRDLNELVDQSLVTKEGDRRWSTYNLAY